jgi:tetratricopeptide (TPR) repeat protein
MNPYYGQTPVVVQQPVVVEQPVMTAAAPYDYSQPINTAGSPPDPATADPAVAAFDEARGVFKEGDYARALELTNQALKTMPNDASAHEFRALCLFALGQYDQAASPLYAVLSVGPGWDWTTLSGLYQSIDTYTQQVRALEQYVRDHPSSAPGHFVLAYHYLTQGNTDAAVAQFKAVVQLQPGDKLSASLAQAYGPKDQTQDLAEAQPPTEPQPAPKPTFAPPDEAALAGAWKATPQPDVTIALALQPEHKFTWSVTQKGKPQSFGGDYTYGGETLTLLQSAGPAMVARLALTDRDHFRFQVVGGPPDDPGLSFAR